MLIGARESGRAPLLGGSALAPQTVAPRAAIVPRSRFRWPLDPAPGVLRRFAVGPQPWSPGHRGVDLAASAGQSVLAAGPGVVTFAGRIAGVGAVSVTHAGGLRTTYQPVAAGVRKGDPVEAGQELGTLGDWPGHCAGPCLHWGALRGRTYLDPLALLGLLPPVLLPVPR
jgi:murein DD-endopeptidase MepM/ murein hydrolase activator NlpD